ncbi:MAG: 4Fe-4S binding protein [Coriobacteriia bacterium]|nr:4Fe-4S binding protein [Coriobacteriia bacterium]
MSEEKDPKKAAPEVPETSDKKEAEEHQVLKEKAQEERIAYAKKHPHSKEAQERAAEVMQDSDAEADDGKPKKKKGMTRRQFSAISGLSIAALVGVGALTKWGVTQHAVATGQVVLNPTPKKMIIVYPDRCSGCQRCEMACTLKNDHKLNSNTARIKVWRNYMYGKSMDSGDGAMRNLQFSQDYCKQCRVALCMQACPVSAIVVSERNGARIVLDDRCIGCGTCTEACPWHMPTVDKVTKKSTKCISCGRCARHCPNGAIGFIDWIDIADEILAKEGRQSTEEMLELNWGGSVDYE